MFVTKKCLSSIHGLLIPPRSTWDILFSASRACVSLISGKKDRERFVECCNKGIIEPPVLGQSSLGMAMMLALYNDLNSPLFSRYKDLFNASDFFAGVAPALERFHDTQYMLQNELHFYKKQESQLRTSSSLRTLERVLDDDMTILPRSESPDNLLDDLLKNLKMIDETVLKSIGFAEKKQVKDVLKHNWNKEALRDSNSPAAQLKNMVTDEYFLDLQMEMKSNFILNNKLIYEEGSTKVQNVALLSVRAKEITPDGDEQNDEANIISNRNRSVFTKVSSPVVAQVEVLYDIEQNFRNDEALDLENDDNDKPVIRKGVLVGVFEGWLCESDSPRWHLCESRTAWEFPYLHSATESQ